MTEEIINSDGSRNWEANILLDNIKRLEQENKELKKQIESDKGLITVGGKQQYKYLQEIDELKQENKELKEKKDKYYQQTLDDEILMNELSLEVDLRKKESDFYLEKLSKYRSALEKIRDLCIHYENTNDKCIINCYAHFIVTDLIQNKINEVLNV